MEDTAKYLIHADISVDGVVERSDVVGAIFGQTEGLLGDELELRGLQQSSKVGRIDVEITSRDGRSEGDVTIASSLDKVETATLAAALETLSRVGPCRASVEIRDIEDVRAAKRRAVVERAKELLASAFDDSVMTTEEILAEIRESVRIEDVTEYEGLPAGPRVGDSDAVVVVEGRSDVLQLLRYGVKNAVAVEGTDVPEAVAELTSARTTTAFLDDDRGGELVLRELEQVGDVDYVAFASAGKAVEDLSRHEVFEALREKVPHAAVAGAATPRDEVAATDGSASPAPGRDAGAAPGTPEPSAAETRDPGADDAASSAGTGERTGTPSDAEANLAASTDDAGATDADRPDGANEQTVVDGVGTNASGVAGTDAPASGTGHEGDGETDAATTGAAEQAEPPANDASDGGSAASGDDEPPATLHDHVRAVVTADAGVVRLLDDDFEVLAETEAGDAFEAVRDADPPPETVVVDGTVDQRLLDVAAQRGVSRVVASERGEFTKRPTGVRVLTVEELFGDP